MKRWMAVLLTLAIAASLPAFAARAEGGSPDGFRTRLEDAGFYVQDGKLYEFDTLGLASQGKLLTCFGNNAGSTYLILDMPPAPEQDAAPGNAERGWDGGRLEPSEIPAHPNDHRRDQDDDRQFGKFSRLELDASDNEPPLGFVGLYASHQSQDKESHCQDQRKQSSYPVPFWRNLVADEKSAKSHYHKPYLLHQNGKVGTALHICQTAGG